MIENINLFIIIVCIFLLYMFINLKNNENFAVYIPNNVKQKIRLKIQEKKKW